ncbi:MAG TPA: cytochrome c [Terriglobia bacterium]|nr:cytochrome c [Terriglobia bacterium]
MKLGLRTGSMMILAAAFAAVLAFASAPQPPDDAGDLFKSKCSMCHGPEGKGFSAIHTPDFTDPKWQASKKDAELKDAIKNGRKDTMMKGFGDKLSDEEISSLVKYIRSLNSSKKK